MTTGRINQVTILQGKGTTVRKGPQHPSLRIALARIHGLQRKLAEVDGGAVL